MTVTIVEDEKDRSVYSDIIAILEIKTEKGSKLKLISQHDFSNCIINEAYTDAFGVRIEVKL